MMDPTQKPLPAPPIDSSEALHQNRILVTGAAGFIGFHLSQRLLREGLAVAGIDNINSYYDTHYKEARLSLLSESSEFSFRRVDFSDGDSVDSVFSEFRPTVVVHLGAQAGVRYSITNPRAYVESNLDGFANILEASRRFAPNHLLYASSSSVYGGNHKVPFSEADPVDHPVSFYAATKRSNELMADSYAHLYKIPSTGLRFFTVYGPYGRPDMAYFSFTERLFKGQPIDIFSSPNPGVKMSRDFTYIDDVIESLVRLISVAPQGPTPHRIVNIGGGQPVALDVFIETLETSLSAALGREVSFIRNNVAAQAGDVPVTYADSSRLEELIGSVPEVTLAEGLKQFSEWYVKFHDIT